MNLLGDFLIDFKRKTHFLGGFEIIFFQQKLS